MDPKTTSKLLAGYTQWDDKVYILTEVIQLFNLNLLSLKNYD